MDMNLKITKKGVSKDSFFHVYLKYITMGCNCEKKKYSISMGCCEPVLGPIENYYTKYQIDKMFDEIESAITSGCCITPEEVDEKIDEATSGLQETLIAGDNITISGNVISASASTCDLSDYYNKTEVNNLLNDKLDASAYTPAVVDQTVNSGSTNAISNAAVYNNYMLKNNIWCGDYTAWSQISGSTNPDTLYLIHQ